MNNSVVQEIRAKKAAAYELIRELLMNSVRTYEVEKGAVSKAIQNFIKDEDQVFSLDEMYHFILCGDKILLIPKKPFGEKDFVIFQGFYPQDQRLTAMLIEFERSNYFESPNVHLLGYLRTCMKRGSRNKSKPDD